MQKQSQEIIKLLKFGSLSSILMLFAIAGASVILYKLNSAEHLYLPCFLLVTLFSGFLSGYFCGKKFNQRGLINGFLGSFLPSIILLTVMIVAYKSFSVYQLIIVIICLTAGMAGGILRANMKKKIKKKRK